MPIDISITRRDLACAILLPLAVHAAGLKIEAASDLGPRATWVSLAVALATGMAFIVRAYRWWALVVGTAYIPAMAMTLFWLGVWYGGWLTGHSF